MDRELANSGETQPQQHEQNLSEQQEEEEQKSGRVLVMRAIQRLGARGRDEFPIEVGLVFNPSQSCVFCSAYLIRIESLFKWVIEACFPR